MKKKTVHVSGKEVVFFNKLFDMIDYDGDDRVCFDSSFNLVGGWKGRCSVPAQIRTG